MTETENKKGFKILSWEDMTFDERALWLRISNFFHSHPKETKWIMNVVEKRQDGIAQRIIEHVISTFARKWNLHLGDGRYNVFSRHKGKRYGMRKDPNCRGYRVEWVYGNRIVYSTFSQMSCNILCSLSPVPDFIAANYEAIKNDLSEDRKLPLKKKCPRVSFKPCPDPAPVYAVKFQQPVLLTNLE